MRREKVVRFFKWLILYIPLLWYLATFPLWVMIYLVPWLRDLIIEMKEFSPILGLIFTNAVTLILIIIVIGTWGNILVVTIYKLPFIRDYIRVNKDR
jgi:hypothetical protein